MPVTGRDEISLFDIWQILAVRKWIVLIAPLVTVAFAIFYLLQATPVYECSAQVLVGQIGKEHQVANPAVIVQKLAGRYRLHDNTASRGMPHVSSVAYDKKESGSIVHIKAVDTTAEGAKGYLEQVVDEFLVEQRNVFAQEMALRQARLKALAARLESAETFRQEIKNHGAMVARQEPAQAAVLAVEQGRFLTLASELEKERFALQAEMSAVDSFPAELLGVPHLPEKPIRPKRALVLLLAGISGVILGLTLAFVVEFTVNARQRMKV